MRQVLEGAKGEMEKRRQGWVAGSLLLLQEVPWTLLGTLLLMSTPIIRAPNHLCGLAFGIPVLVGQGKDRQNAWARGDHACQRGL